MPDHTYKVIDLVGSSPEGVDQAIENAIARANQTIKQLEWFQVTEIRGHIVDGNVGHYQVSLKVGFRILDAQDMQQG